MVARCQSDFCLALAVMDYDLVFLHVERDGGIIDFDDDLPLVCRDSDELAAKEESHKRKHQCEAKACADRPLFPPFATRPSVAR